MRRYPLDLVIMESAKDPASATGTVKNVKRTKIFSSLGSSDEGEGRSLEGGGGDCMPSPLLPTPNFASPEEGEDDDNNPLHNSRGVLDGSRSALNGSRGALNTSSEGVCDSIYFTFPFSIHFRDINFNN